MTLLMKQVEIPVKLLAQRGLDGRHAESYLPVAIGNKLNISPKHLTNIQVLKKSTDARHKGDIILRYQVCFDVEQEDQLLQKRSGLLEKMPSSAKTHPLDDIRQGARPKFRHKPIVVGSGPAGIFSALILAEAGYPCLVIERGQAVEQRMRDVHKLRRTGDFKEESNYCYGEGGAGTFSDGKLSSGKNHPLIEYLFDEWVRFGAPPEILYDAKPHIGTDYLMKIARNMRLYLQERGVEFVFESRMDDWIPQPEGASARHKITLSGGQTLETDHLLLAIGHSARETYHMLRKRGLEMAPKPFAMGARFEHPQAVIDKIQFGQCTLLPPAEYKLVSHAPGDRGIWTFCMCPGGHLLPTSAQASHLAINGMSYHSRSSGFANAAVVVNVRREDFFKGDIFDGMYLQESIEKKAFEMGGRNYFSPAQRLNDFLNAKLSTGSLLSSYKPGVTSSRLDHLLPEFIVNSLKYGLHEYNKTMKGFINEDAVVVGVETKTSSPIVMPRDKSFQSQSHPGFFPTGEGAGFAGGIVSAALDGVRVGLAVLQDAAANSPSRTTHVLSPTPLEQKI